MGAKRIKKRRFVPDLARVNRALRAIASNKLTYTPAGVAPAPIWELTGPLPGTDDPDAPIPAIVPQLVDPVIVITDRFVVADFEATGMTLSRIGDQDQENVLLWLIDKSRSLDARKVDTEFAIDMGSDIRNRNMGAILADLAKAGNARTVATRDDSKIIVQIVVKPKLGESGGFNQWIEYWRNRKAQ